MISQYIYIYPAKLLCNFVAARTVAYVLDSASLALHLDISLNGNFIEPSDRPGKYLSVPKRIDDN